MISSEPRKEMGTTPTELATPTLTTSSIRYTLAFYLPIIMLSEAGSDSMALTVILQ